MPEQPVTRKKAKRPRFNYAVEQVVDRTVREQNRFLDHCQNHRVELTLFSVTGASFNGIVHAFDRETILFGGSGKNANPRLIIKRFIALIIPRDAVDLFQEYKGLGTARTKNRKQRFIEAIENLGRGFDLHQDIEVSPAGASLQEGSLQVETAGLRPPAKKGRAVATKAQSTRVIQPPKDGF